MNRSSQPQYQPDFTPSSADHEQVPDSPMHLPLGRQFVRPRGLLRPSQLLLLQRRYGNRAVQRMIQSGRKNELQRSGEDELDPREGIILFETNVTRPLQFERKNDDPDVGRIQARVDVRAIFDHERFDPSRFEYRQYIKGHVELHDRGSGTTISLDERFRHLPEGRLTDSWQEDGDTSLGEGMAGYHYGHRDYEASGDGLARDSYEPDRENGHLYAAFDYPELVGVPCAAGDRGDSFVWRMNFCGEIHYDGHAIMASFWNVEGTIVIPEQAVGRVIAS